MDIHNDITWMTPMIDWFFGDFHQQTRMIGTRPPAKVKAKRLTLVDGSLYRKARSGRPLLRCINIHTGRVHIVKIHEGDCGSHEGYKAMALKARRQGFD